MRTKLLLKNEKVKHRRLAGFGPILLVWSIAEGMLIFYLPLFVESQFNSLFLVGIFLGINAFASLAADVLFGFFTEVNDFRKFFYWSLILEVFVAIVLMFGSGWLAILLMVIAWGTRYELFLRFGTTIFLAKTSPVKELGIANAIYLGIRGFGFFLGPIIGDYLNNINPDFVGFAFLVMLAVNAVWSFMLFSTMKLHPRKVPYSSPIAELTILKQNFHKIMPFMALSFGLASLESIFYIFGALEFERLTDVPGLVLSLGLFMLVITPYLTSYLLLKQKNFKRIISIFVSVIVVVTSIYIYLDMGQKLDSTFGLMLIVALLFGALGVMWEINDEMFLRFLSRIKKSDEDEIVSTSGVVINLGYIVVGVIGGALYEGLGFAAVLTMALAFFLFGSITFLLKAKSKKA